MTTTAMADSSFFIPGGRDGVLLVHGLTGTPAEMRFIGKGLAQAGFTVYGVQLAGHCGTEDDLLATGHRDWFESVQQALHVLGREVENVFACGLSMGAVLALKLAAANPDRVRGLGLFSTTLRYDGWSIPKARFLLPLVAALPFARRLRFVESFPYGIKDERLRRVVVSKMREGKSREAGLIGTPFGSLREMRRLTAEVMKLLPTIHTPALVVHAREDDVTGLSNVRFLEQRLGGPVSTVLLDDCYHMITVDKQREQVVRATVDFFNTLNPVPVVAT